MKARDFKKNVNDLPLDVMMLWGIKPRDMSACSRKTYKTKHPCRGRGVFDDTFDMEKPSSQIAMRVSERLSIHFS